MALGSPIFPSSCPESGRSPGVGHGNPLQYSCLANPMDRGAWWAAVHGVAKSWQDEALARHGVSREVPCFALKGETVPDSLPTTPKSPPTRRGVDVVWGLPRCVWARECMAWRAIPGPLSKRKRRLDSLEAAQGAPRSPVGPPRREDTMRHLQPGQEPSPDRASTPIFYIKPPEL